MSLRLIESKDFQRRQWAFAAHLRDPAGHPPPEGMPERGLAVYRELVFSNLEGLLAGTFPVLKATLGEEAWPALVRDFLAEHRAATPLFPAVAEELLAYLAEEREARLADPPFLAELAHYEWAELALSLAAEPDRAGIDPDGDPLAGPPVVSPLAWGLTYRFSVHRIGPDFRPDAAPAEPTHLLVYRDPDEEVGFLAVSAPVLRLLELLDGAITGAEALERLAGGLGADPGSIREYGRGVLTDLARRGILLGIAREPATGEV